MNSSRRQRVSTIANSLDDIIILIEDIVDEEDAARDNVPENLRESRVYYAMEEAIENLNDAIDHLCSAQEYLDMVSS